MKRDTATLHSWEQVAAALDEQPDPAHGREFWFDAYIVVSIIAVTALSAVGAWTVARWIWSLT